METKPSYKRNYYTSDDAGKVGIIAILAPFVVAFLLSLLLGAIASAADIDSASLNNYLWYTLPTVFVAPISFILVYLLYNKVCKVSYGAVNVKFNIGWKNTLICIVVGVVMIFGLNYLINCTDYLIGLTGYKLSGSMDILPWSNAGWLILNIIVWALLPAISEELIFRGMILKGLRNTTTDTIAVLISATLFALMHASLEQLIYPFLMGLILGWLVLRTGSTFSSMIVHFVNNLIVVVMYYFIGSSTRTAPLWWEIMLAFILLAVTIAIIYLIERFYFKRKNQTEEIKERGKLSIFVWIALGVGLFIFLFGVVWNFTSPA